MLIKPKKLQVSTVFLFVLLTFGILVSDVIAQAPFQVKPTTSSINFYGNAMINGTPLEIGDMIGAFAPDVEINDGCVGRFEITTSGKYGSMPVYGNDPNTPDAKDGAAAGDEISFKIWDASTNQIYDATPKGPDDNIWSGGPFKNVNLDVFFLSQPELSVTAGDGFVKLQWEEVFEAEGYRVYRRLSDSDYELLADFGQDNNQLTYTDNSVQNGITYYYRVAAYIGDLESFSIEKDLTPPFSYVTTPLSSLAKGNAYIGGAPAAKGDILAAFVAGEEPEEPLLCIGAHQIETSDGRYELMLLYGDNPSTPYKDGAYTGDEIVFRIWDASADVIILGDDVRSEPETIIWRKNVTYKVDLYFLTDPILNIHMCEGWNMISFPVARCYYDPNIPPFVPPDPAILPAGTELVDITTLGQSSLADWFTSVLTANCGEWGPENHPWRMVIGALPGGAAFIMDSEKDQSVNTLQFISPGYAYWVNIKAEACGANLTLEGKILPPNTPLDYLKKGWNYVGYLSDVSFYNTSLPNEENLYVTDQVWEEKPAPVAEYVLASITDDHTPKYQMVQGAYCGGESIVYNPTIPVDFNTLNFFAVGNGYLIKLYEDATLIYPSASEAAAPGRFVIRRQPQFPDDGVMPTHSSMFLYGSVTVAGQPAAAGSRIAVWTENGLCCGVGRVTGDGVFSFLPIYGDDVTTPKVDGANIGEALSVTVNGVAADLDIPLRWLGQNTIQSVALTVDKHHIPSFFAVGQNYPNPFNPETWIPYKLSETSPVTLQIYSVTGDLVRNLHIGVKPAGVYTKPGRAIYWDGRNDSGEKVSSGVYFYRFNANGFYQTKRMVLIK
jgi:hypothetical protein